MTTLEFVKMFINERKRLNKLNKLAFVGVHSVISGLNDEIRAVFGEEGMGKDRLKELPIAIINRLVTEGHLVTVPAKRGVMVYLIEDAPKTRVSNKKSRADVLAKYGIMSPPPVIAPPSTAGDTAQ